MTLKASSMDRSFWPMGMESQGERVAKGNPDVVTPLATTSDSLAIDFCELVVSAFVRRGYDDKQAAAAMQTNYKVFQKAMNTAPNYDAYNPVMKRLGQIPGDVLKEFASLLAERVGLSVGIDSEQVRAAVELSSAIQKVFRVGQR